MSEQTLLQLFGEQVMYFFQSLAISYGAECNLDIIL